jgi:hypothetical protein
MACNAGIDMQCGHLESAPRVRGIREIHVRDVYKRDWWLDSQPGEVIVEFGSNIGNSPPWHSGPTRLMGRRRRTEPVAERALREIARTESRISNASS